jgi:hypothetical protein
MKLAIADRPKDGRAIAVGLDGDVFDFGLCHLILLRTGCAPSRPPR